MQYLQKSMSYEIDFLPVDKHKNFLQIDSITLGVHGQACPKHPKQKKWMTKLTFCMQVTMKTYFKLRLWFWWRWSSISKVPKIASLQCLYNISKKKLEMKLIFCMQINTQVSKNLHYRFWWKQWIGRFVIFLQHIKKNVFCFLITAFVM